jgi:hypothetical protein
LQEYIWSQQIRLVFVLSEERKGLTTSEINRETKQKGGRFVLKFQGEMEKKKK